MLSMVLTFSLTVFAWIFFRAENLMHAFSYIGEIFSSSLFSFPEHFGGWKALMTLLSVIIFMLVEWLQRDKQYALDLSLFRGGRYVRWGIYLIIILAIISFGGQQQEFIYFQF
jgi:alginate O-acetyltransferase complex protein AlgI